MKYNNKLFSFLFKGLLMLVLAISVYSCKDELDGKTFFTSDKLTVSELLEEDPETYSMYKEILVKTGFYNTLKSYGKYTCFVPTNTAVEQYLKDTWNVTSLDELNTESQIEDLKTLVKFHVIPVKYNTDDFEEGRFVDTTYTGDFLTTSFLQGGGVANVEINREATLVQYDIEANNGVIHQIDKVLTPFTFPIVKNIENTGQYTIFVEALKQTGYYSEFSETRLPNGNRKYFTLFIETDEVYNQDGITSFSELAARYSPNDSNYLDKENPLNKFVAYHATANFLYVTDFPEDGFINTVMENGAIKSYRTEKSLKLNQIDPGTPQETWTSLDLTKSNFPARNGVYHSVGKIFEVFTPPAQYIIFDVIADQPEYKNGSVRSFGWYGSDAYSEMSWFPDREERFITRNRDTHLNGNTFGPGASIYWDMLSPTIPVGKYELTVCAAINSRNGTVGQFLWDGVPIGPAFDGGTQATDVGWRLLNPFSEEDEGARLAMEAEMESNGWRPGLKTIANGDGVTAYENNGTWSRKVLTYELLCPVQKRHDIRLQIISGTGLQIDYFEFIPVVE